MTDQIVTNQIAMMQENANALLVQYKTCTLSLLNDMPSKIHEEMCGWLEELGIKNYDNLNDIMTLIRDDHNKPINNEVKNYLNSCSGLINHLDKNTKVYLQIHHLLHDLETSLLRETFHKCPGIEIKQLGNIEEHSDNFYPKDEL